MNQKQIDLFNSKPHALHNDGSLEQLQEVMKILFPTKLPPVKGSFKYYYAYTNGDWDMSDNTILPTIKVTSFFEDKKVMRDYPRPDADRGL